jgi:hypothetical protein
MHLSPSRICRVRDQGLTYRLACQCQHILFGSPMRIACESDDDVPLADKHGTLHEVNVLIGAGLVTHVVRPL